MKNTITVKRLPKLPPGTIQMTITPYMEGILKGLFEIEMLNGTREEIMDGTHKMIFYEIVTTVEKAEAFQRALIHALMDIKPNNN